jgi:tRNA threonylcarbamoyladenosine biosynthesis protein TsaB
MLTLGFDTATKIGTIGLVDGEEVIGEYTFSASESQSEKLLTSIDLLLEKTSVDISEVNRIAVSRGPGSFTGLRIGISTAKGLSSGLDVPLVGVPLTDCYFSRVKKFSGPVCTLIKDRRDLVYTAGYDSNGEKVLDERSVSVEKLKEDLIPDLVSESKRILLVGNGVPEHRDTLSEVNQAVLEYGCNNYPSGLGIAFLGQEKGTQDEALASLEPLYAQRPIAEINWSED